MTWIRGFVAAVSSHGQLSLEDKIERLQRRLGGQPLRFEDQLTQVVEREAREKEQALMRQFQLK